MTALVVAGAALATVALCFALLCLAGLVLEHREQRRAAKRQAVVLLAQQRMRAVTRATLEAMRQTGRTDWPGQRRNWSGR